MRKALGEDYSPLLRFKLCNRATDNVDIETGEIISIVSEACENEPLHRLWHLIYSIRDRCESALVLKGLFRITDEAVIDRLFALDFVKQGYANKSAKAMRRILPYLELGANYAEACQIAGFNHCDSLTKAENSVRELQDRLIPLEKNALLQPVVEKILNQMINVVNAVMERYGRFDEIRVKLARDLKQSREERAKATSEINKVNVRNKSLAQRIFEEYHLSPTCLLADAEIKNANVHAAL